MVRIYRLASFNLANNIIDEHDVLLRSSSRLVASRNVLLDFKKRVDEIMEAAVPLLSIELYDGSEDKDLGESNITIEFEKHKDNIKKLKDNTA